MQAQSRKAKNNHLKYFIESGKLQFYKRLSHRRPLRPLRPLHDLYDENKNHCSTRRAALAAGVRLQVGHRCRPAAPRRYGDVGGQYGRRGQKQTRSPRHHGRAGCSGDIETVVKKLPRRIHSRFGQEVRRTRRSAPIDGTDTNIRTSADIKFRKHEKQAENEYPDRRRTAGRHGGGQHQRLRDERHPAFAPRHSPCRSPCPCIAAPGHGAARLGNDTYLVGVALLHC